MQRHLRHCPACSERKAADDNLDLLLHADAGQDAPEEAAAIARLTQRWSDTLTESRPVAAVRPRVISRRWLSASALGAAGIGIFTFLAVTAPSRAIGAVSDAMKRVQRFHMRMEIEGMPQRYEAWGERDRAARVEEWEGKKLTLIVLDNGKTLRSYDPDAHELMVSGTRLKSVMRQTLGFSATKMLRKAAQGQLFSEQEWLGEAQAREVAQIRRNGIGQRRIEVDLKNGFFERMVVYADLKTDRLTQANLYMDRNKPDDQPAARVWFDYPEIINPMLFKLHPAPGTEVKQQATELSFP